MVVYFMCCRCMDDGRSVRQFTLLVSGLCGGENCLK